MRFAVNSDLKLSNKVFYPEFIVQDKEILLGTSKVQLLGLGSKYPALWINKTLAFELSWFEEDDDESDPRFAIKLGPNLCLKLNSHEIPSTQDIESFYTASGHAQHVTPSNKYWIRPRWADGSFMDYI